MSIYRDSEWDEFVVVTKGGPSRRAMAKPTTYHTTDKQDARNTAAAQARWLKRTGVCYFPGRGG